MMARLVERLAAVQAALGDTDEQFAQRIGVSRPLWSMVRAGTARFGWQSVRKVIAFAPGLRDEGEAYLDEIAGAAA